MKFDWRLLVLHIIYFILLLFVYTTYIVDIYGYAGFKDALNIKKALFAPLAITSAFVLLRNNGLPSYLFLNLIIASTVTPSFVIFCGSDLPFSFIAVTWLAFAILAIMARFFRLRQFRTIHIDATMLLRWIAGLSLLFIASIFMLGGGRFINFDLSLVYDFRRDAADNLPSIFGYLISNFSKAILPIGIVLSLLHKKWLLLLIFMFCSVMIFALSSNKGPLFMPIAIIFIYWFSRRPKPANLSLLALITVALIGSLDFYLKQSGIGGIAGWFGYLSVNRTLLVPSLLNWAYYDFFSVNPYDYWSSSRFSFGLSASSYDLDIPALIGKEFFGDAENFANTGWIGSGMANAGYFGIALYSILIGSLLLFIDAYAKKLGNSMMSSVFLISVMTATRGLDFTAMFLTGGLFVLLFIVILLKPKKITKTDIGAFKKAHYC